MKDINYYCKLYSVVYELIERTKQDIKEFEIAIGDSDLKKKGLLNIGTAYMNSIIIALAKLFSITKSDKTGLKQIKNNSPEELKNKIETIEKKYGDIIKKVSANRNRIIVHIDISDKNAYYNMGISKTECERVISDYKKSSHYKSEDSSDPFIESISKIQAMDKNNERYCLSDFQKDIPEIKKILEEIKIIRDEFFEKVICKIIAK